jgi:hypothetical protein
VSMVRSSMALRDSSSRDLFSDMWIAMEDGASPLSSSSCYTYVRTIHTLDGWKIDLILVVKHQETKRKQIDYPYGVCCGVVAEPKN